MLHRSGASALVGVMLIVPSIAIAQQVTPSVSLHASGQHSYKDGKNSYGGGGSFSLTLGPDEGTKLEIGTTGNFLRVRDGSSKSLSASVNANIQPPGSGALSPFIGVSVMASWSSGGGDKWTDPPKAGIDGILGVSAKFSQKSRTSIELQIRPGYLESEGRNLEGRIALSRSFGD